MDAFPWMERPSHMLGQGLLPSVSASDHPLPPALWPASQVCCMAIEKPQACLCGMPCPVFSLPTACWPHAPLAGFLGSWLLSTVMCFQKCLPLVFNSRCLPLPAVQMTWRNSLISGPKCQIWLVKSALGSSSQQAIDDTKPSWRAAEILSLVCSIEVIQHDMPRR